VTQPRQTRCFKQALARVQHLFTETRGVKLTASPLPQFLLDMISDGGLVPHLEKRFAAKRAAAGS